MDTQQYNNPLIQNVLSGGYVNNPKYNPKAKGSKNKPPEPKYIKRNDVLSFNESPWHSYNKRATALEFTLNDLGVTEEEYKSNYERGVVINPYISQDEVNKALANKQSWMEQAANFVTQSVASEIVLGTLLGLSNLVDMGINVFTPEGEDDYTNPVSTALENAQEYIKEKFKIYRENPNKTFDFSDSGWYFDNAVTIFSTLSMLIPSTFVTKGISWLGRIGKALAKGTKVEKAMRSIRMGTYRGLGKLANADSVFKQARIANSIKSFGEIGITAGLSRTMENYMEAREVYKEVYDDAYNNLQELKKDENKEQLNRFLERNPQFKDKDDEYIAKYIASVSADETFVNDYAMLAFDFMQLKAIGSLWKGVVNKEATAAMRIAARNESNKLLGKPLEKTGFLANRKEAIRYGIKHPFTSPLFAELNEGVEEAFQGIQTEKGKEVGKIYFDPNFNRRTLESYLTDSAIWEQAFWGWMGGIGFQGVGNIVGKGYNKLRDYNLERKHKKGKITDEEYEALKLSSDRLRISDIEGYSNLTQKYADTMRRLSGDNPTRPNSVKKDEHGKPILDENGLTQEEEISKEEAEILKEIATNNFITRIGLHAMDLGNFETLRAYLEDEKVDEFFRNNGIIGHNGTSLNRAIIDRLDNTYTYYKNAIENIYANGNVEENETGIVRAYARQIAMNKLNRDSMREQLDSVEASILENDPDLTVTQDVRNQHIKDFIDNRLAILERKERQLNRMFNSDDRGITRAGYDYEMQNIAEEKQRLLQFARKKLGYELTAEDESAYALLDEYNRWKATIIGREGEVSEALQEKINRAISTEYYLHNLEEDIPVYKNDYMSQFDEFRDSMNKFGKEKCDKALEIIEKFIKNHSNPGEAFDKIFSDDFTEEELNNNPGLKDALDVLKIGCRNTMAYTVALANMTDSIIKNREKSKKEESKITVNGNTQEDNGQITENLSNFITDEDKQLAENYINNATDDQIQAILNDQIPDEFKDKDSQLFDYLKSLAVDKTKTTEPKAPKELLSDTYKNQLFDFVNKNEAISNNENILKQLANKQSASSFSNISDENTRNAAMDYVAELAKQRLKEIRQQKQQEEQKIIDNLSEQEKKLVDDYISNLSASELYDYVKNNNLISQENLEQFNDNQILYFKNKIYKEYGNRVNGNSININNMYIHGALTMTDSVDLTEEEIKYLDDYYNYYVKDVWQAINSIIKGKLVFIGKRADLMNAYILKKARRNKYILQQEDEWLDIFNKGNTKPLETRNEKVLTPEEKAEMNQKLDEIDNKLDKDIADLHNEFNNKLRELRLNAKIRGIKPYEKPLIDEYKQKQKAIEDKYNEDYDAIIEEYKGIDDKTEDEELSEKVNDIVEENNGNPNVSRAERLFDSMIYNGYDYINELTEEQKESYLRALNSIKHLSLLPKDKLFKVGDILTITKYFDDVNDNITVSHKEEVKYVITFVDENNAFYATRIDENGEEIEGTTELFYPDAIYGFHGKLFTNYKILECERLGFALEPGIETNVVNEEETKEEEISENTEQVPEVLEVPEVTQNTQTAQASQTSQAPVNAVDDMGFENDEIPDADYIPIIKDEDDQAIDDFESQPEAVKSFIEQQANYLETDVVEAVISNTFVYVYQLNMDEDNTDMFTNILVSGDIKSKSFKDLKDKVIEFLKEQNVPEQYLDYVAMESLSKAFDVIRNMGLNTTIDNSYDAYSRLITQIANANSTRNSSIANILGDLNKNIEDFLDAYVKANNIKANRNGVYVIDIIELFKELSEYTVDGKKAFTMTTLKYFLYNMKDFVRNSNAKSKYIFRNRRYLNNTLKNANDYLNAVLERIYINEHTEDVTKGMHISGTNSANMNDDIFNSAIENVKSGDVLEVKEEDKTLSIRHNGVELGFLAKVLSVGNTYRLYDGQGFKFEVSESNGNYSFGDVLDKFFNDLIDTTNDDFKRLLEIVTSYFVSEENIKDGYASTFNMNAEMVKGLLENKEVCKLLGINPYSTVITGTPYFTINKNHWSITTTLDNKLNIKDSRPILTYLIKTLSNILYYDKNVKTKTDLKYSIQQYKQRVFENYKNTRKIQEEIAKGNRVGVRVNYTNAYIPKRSNKNRDIVDRDFGFTREKNHFVFVNEQGEIIDEAANGHNQSGTLPNRFNMRSGQVGILLDADAKENSVAPAIAVITEANNIGQNPNNHIDAINKQDVVNEITDILKAFQEQKISFNKVYNLLSDLMGGIDTDSNTANHNYLFAGFVVAKGKNQIFINDYKTKKPILVIHKYRNSKDGRNRIEGTGISFSSTGDKTNHESHFEVNDAFLNKIANHFANNLKFNRTFYTIKVREDNDTSNSRNHAMFKQDGKLHIKLGGREIVYDNFTHFAFANNAFKTNQGGSVSEGLKVVTSRDFYVDVNTVDMSNFFTEENKSVEDLLKSANKKTSVKTTDVLRAAGYSDDFISTLSGDNPFKISLIFDEVYRDSKLTGVNAIYNSSDQKMYFSNKGINAAKQSSEDLLRNLIHEKIHNITHREDTFSNQQLVSDLIDVYDVFKKCLERDIKNGKITGSLKDGLENLVKTLDDIRNTKDINEFVDEWLAESLSQKELMKYLNNTLYIGDYNSHIDNVQNKSLWQKIIDLLLKYVFGVVDIKNNTIFARQYLILADNNNINNNIEVTEVINKQDNAQTPVEEESTPAPAIDITDNELEMNNPEPTPVNQEGVAEEAENVTEETPEETEVKEESKEETEKPIKRRDHIDIFGDIYGDDEDYYDDEEDEEEYEDDEDKNTFKRNSSIGLITSDEAKLDAYYNDTKHNPNGMMTISNMDDFINIFPLAERVNIAQMVASNNAKHTCR